MLHNNKDDEKNKKAKKRGRSKVRNLIGGHERKFIADEAQKLSLANATPLGKTSPVVSTKKAATGSSVKQKSGLGKAEFKFNQEQVQKIIEKQPPMPRMVTVTTAPLLTCHTDEIDEAIAPAALQDDEITPEVAAPTATFFAEQQAATLTIKSDAEPQDEVSQNQDVLAVTANISDTPAIEFNFADFDLDMPLQRENEFEAILADLYVPSELEKEIEDRFFILDLIARTQAALPTPESEIPEVKTTSKKKRSSLTTYSLIGTGNPEQLEEDDQTNKRRSTRLAKK